MSVLYKMLAKMFATLEYFSLRSRVNNRCAFMIVERSRRSFIPRRWSRKNITSFSATVIPEPPTGWRMLKESPNGITPGRMQGATSRVWVVAFLGPDSTVFVYISRFHSSSHVIITPVPSTCGETNGVTHCVFSRLHVFSSPFWLPGSISLLSSRRM